MCVVQPTGPESLARPNFTERGCVTRIPLNVLYSSRAPTFDHEKMASVLHQNAPKWRLLVEDICERFTRARKVKKDLEKKGPARYSRISFEQKCGCLGILGVLFTAFLWKYNRVPGTFVYRVPLVLVDLDS